MYLLIEAPFASNRLQTCSPPNSATSCNWNSLQDQNIDSSETNTIYIKGVLNFGYDKIVYLFIRYYIFKSGCSLKFSSKMKHHSNC